MAGGPITWRSIMGQSLADASRPLQAAQQSFDGAFNTLNRVLGQHQDAAQFAQNKVKTDNTQSFLDSLQQYRTVEDFEAARNAGVFDNLRSQFGDQVDRSAIRGAEDARVATLRDQLTKANVFQDQQTERQWRPTRERLLSMASSGDKDQVRSAREALAVYSGEGLPNAGELAGTILGADRANTRFDWDEQNQKMRIRKDNSDLELNGLRAQESRLNLSEKKRDIEDKAAERMAVELYSQRAAEHVTKANQGLKDLGMLARSMGLPTSPGGYVDVGSLAPDVRDNLLSTARENGVYLAGDTDSAMSAANSLREAGVPAFRAENIRKQYGELFSGVQDPIGHDKAVLEADKRRQDKLNEAYQKNNPMALQKDNPLGNLQAISDTVNSTIGKTDPESAPIVLNAATEYLTKPFMIDGKAYDVPVAAIQYAIQASRDTNWLFPNNVESNFENALKKVLQNPTLIRMLEENTAGKGNNTPENRTEQFKRALNSSR